MSVAAIIVAAGRGARLGAGVPKQFLDVGGRTMLDMSIEAFVGCPAVDEVVVAVAPEYADRVRPHPRVRVVEGGARRQDSMANAFAALSDEVDLVLVHDAARPFVSRSLIARTLSAAREHGAAIAALPVRDTVKRARADARVIQETIPRETIYLAQTPQAFRRDVLARALAEADGAEVTDEAMLVERLGVPVHLVEGEPGNVKITTADDLAAARARVRGAGPRIGTGYDLHRLVPDRPLILAGVRVPFAHGLQGHSDADIVCHAVTDAILGAAAAGDIGRLFPDTDPAWKDADSLRLLRSAMDVVRRTGYAVGNLDVTVIAERPKLQPYLEQMRANLAEALEVDIAQVSIKGKTNEQVDATGRGEAMACHAVALLTPLPK